jgi:S1-C subfamily serine protease
VVGIVGSGHLRHGHGVAHQLRDLGIRDIATMLPVDGIHECGELRAGLADAVFAAPRAPGEPAPPPRLGVQLAGRPDAVEIVAVTAGSLAEQTGLQRGDRIVAVAGVPVKTSARVVAAVRTQPPGTWLPLTVRRGDETLDLVVRFPPKT